MTGESPTMKNTVSYILSAALLLMLSSCGPRGRIEVGPVVFLPTPPVGFIPEMYDADTTQVRTGDSFTGLMNRLGLGATGAYALTQRCEGIFDVRKLRAGNQVQAYYETAPDGTRKLCYVVYVEDRIRSTVFQCADSLAIWKVEKPVEHRRGLVDVTINSSLWNDMIAAGGSPNLIMTLADIYQWSVNFFALQKDDRFRMIYTESVCEGEVVGIDTVHFCLYNGASGKEVAAVRFDTGESDRGTYWDKGGESLKRMFLKAPLKYNRISSGFSYARVHPVTGQVRAHTAVDYAAPTGTPVHALGDGTVTKLGWDPGGGGNRIRLKHAQGYETSYMHLSKFAPGLKVGSRVSQGQLIGYVGATGTATGPHLDFRVFQNGKAINPLSLNSPASEPLDKKYLDAFNALYDKWMAALSVIPGNDAVIPGPTGDPE